MNAPGSRLPAPGSRLPAPGSRAIVISSIILRNPFSHISEIFTQKNLSHYTPSPTIRLPFTVFRYPFPVYRPSHSMKRDYKQDVASYYLSRACLAFLWRKVAVRPDDGTPTAHIKNVASFAWHSQSPRVTTFLRLQFVCTSDTAKV